VLGGPPKSKVYPVYGQQRQRQEGDDPQVRQFVRHQHPPLQQVAQRRGDGKDSRGGERHAPDVIEAGAGTDYGAQSQQPLENKIVDGRGCYCD
jgi:hypothetical protein